MRETANVLQLADEVLHDVANLFARPDQESGEETAGRDAAA